MTCRDFPPFISYSIMYFCSQTLTSLKDIKNDHKEAYLESLTTDKHIL